MESILFMWYTNVHPPHYTHMQTHSPLLCIMMHSPLLCIGFFVATLFEQTSSTHRCVDPVSIWKNVNKRCFMTSWMELWVARGCCGAKAPCRRAPLWSDPVGARRRRAKALYRRAPLNRGVCVEYRTVSDNRVRLIAWSPAHLFDCLISCLISCSFEPLAALYVLYALSPDTCTRSHTDSLDGPLPPPLHAHTHIHRWNNWGRNMIVSKEGQIWERWVFMDETMPCINNSCHIKETFLSLEICHGRRRYWVKLFRMPTSEILIVVII